MKVEAIALGDFIHGDINARRGHPCRHRNGELIDEGLAGDLERAGLVRIRMTAAAPATPAAPAAPVKPADDGLAQPSSASQAGQASTTMTSSSSKTGGSKTRKPAT